MKSLLASQRFVPAGALKVTAKDSDMIAYLYELRGRFVALIYAGRANKPYSWFNYATAERREKMVRASFQARAERLAAKVAASAARKAWVNPYKVGDLFDSSWGYDQTNVDFFEVVEVRGKHLIVKQIAGATSQDNVPVECGKVVPLPGAFRADGPSWRVLAQDGGFKSPIHGWARFMQPVMVAGIPTYKAQYWSAYA